MTDITTTETAADGPTRRQVLLTSGTVVAAAALTAAIRNHTSSGCEVASEAVGP